MDDRRRIKISKYLSKHLRHQPHRLGLTLEHGGWIPVDELLRACATHQFRVTPAELEEIVAGGEKRRFSFDQERTRIRADYGHSVDVNLELEPSLPPAVLFHGTSEKSAASIRASGIGRAGRTHVHLSADVGTATRVGRRHGRPVIFAVDTEAMVRSGYQFWMSTGKVWLVEHVPPEFLKEH